MRQLEIFNTIRCIDSDEIMKQDFVDMKYGGFLSITQSGEDKNIIKAMKMAYKNNLTCFNVVNVENSPITKLIDQIRDEDLLIKKQNSSSQNILFNASDEDSEEDIVDKNIGLYQKSGHCYSDVKSFIPQVVCLALIAIWFSDKKQNQSIQSTQQRAQIQDQRKQLIQDIGYLSLRMKGTLQPSYLEKYKAIAQFLKGQDNIFLLAKGLGHYVADFIAQKFCQIAAIHAEAYPSAEFRHGPLSMLDEEEKTAGKYFQFLCLTKFFFIVIFFVLDDENIQQVLANILQVKERGATVIVITNLPRIDDHISSKDKIDHLIEIFPQPSLLSALLCTTPLLMVCYYTALCKGLNPDS